MASATRFIISPVSLDLGARPFDPSEDARGFDGRTGSTAVAFDLDETWAGSVSE
jgi:hypothetical protein